MKWFKRSDGIWGIIILFVLFWTLKIEPNPIRQGRYAIYVIQYQSALEYLYFPVSPIVELSINLTKSPLMGIFGFILGILIFGFLYGIIVGAAVRLILRSFKAPKRSLAEGHKYIKATEISEEKENNN